MAVEINWGLLQPVDIGGSFVQGLEYGQKKARQAAVEGALATMADTVTAGGAANGAAGGSLVATPEQQERSRRAEGVLLRYAPEQYAAYQRISMAREKAIQDAQERQRAVAIGGLYTRDPRAAQTEALQAGDFDLASKLQALDKPTQDQAVAFIKTAGPLAFKMRQMTDPAQRKAFLDANRPALIAAGSPPEAIDSFDVANNDVLDGYIAMNRSVEQQIADGKITWHQQGEQPSFATDAFGRPVGNNNPYSQQFGGGSPPPAGGGGAGAPHPAAQAVGSVLSTAFPSPVVAGFLGNFHAEGGYDGAQGDGGASGGAAQWNGPRRENFRRMMGVDPTQATPEQTGKFVIWEMQNPEAAGMTVEQRDAIMNAKTPGEAAALIDQYYERSSGEHRQRRVSAAERFAGGAPIKVASKQAFDALPSGTHFIAPDGSERVKP